MLMNRKSSLKQQALGLWPLDDTQSEVAKRFGHLLQTHATRLIDAGAWVNAALTDRPEQCFFQKAAGITVDATRQAWDLPLRVDLTAWSIAQGLERFRDDQFAGGLVNLSEARAVPPPARPPAGPPGPLARPPARRLSGNGSGPHGSVRTG